MVGLLHFMSTHLTGIGDVEKMYGLKTQMIRKF